MKNKLIDLNNHLFAQLERLSDEDLKPKDIEVEVRRTEAIVKVSDQIVENARLHLQAAKIIADHGAYAAKHIPMLASGSSAPVIEGERS